MPLCPVHDGNLTATAANDLMNNNFGHMQVYNLFVHVIDDDVVGRQRCRVPAEHVLGQTSREMLGVSLASCELTQSLHGFTENAKLSFFTWKFLGKPR